jgi:chitinase
LNNCDSGIDEDEPTFIAPIILAYFTSWSIYERQYFVSDIPADKITHISYAIAKIDSEGRISLADPYADTIMQFPEDKVNQSLRGNFNQLIKLKKKYPHLRTLISVGGDVSASFR